MPGGRPSKYQDRFCDELITHMAEGFSFESFAAECFVNRDTVHEWALKHPEFSEAKKRGEAESRRWWEGQAKQIAQGGDGNPTMVIFALKNKFPAEWRDRQQHEHTGEGGGPVIFQTIYETDKREKS